MREYSIKISIFIVRFLLTLFVISVLTFLLIKMAPGDPAANYLRALHIHITEENLKAVTEKMGFDDPIYIQYGRWIRDVLEGNLGISYIKREPVTKMIFEAMIPTLKMGLSSFFWLSIIAIFLGIISALRKDGYLDKFIGIFCYGSVSMPSFWLGYLLIIAFSVMLPIFPVSGMLGTGSLVLPCITLMMPILGKSILLVRKSLLEAMEEPHVKNAILRGVEKKYIILNHLLRNALPSIITLFSSNILYLITGSIIVEQVFSWNGLGRLFVDSVQTGDIPLIQGCLLLFGFLAIIVNFLNQFVLYCMNPRKIDGGGALDA